MLLQQQSDLMKGMMIYFINKLLKLYNWAYYKKYLEMINLSCNTFLFQKNGAWGISVSTTTFISFFIIESDNYRAHHSNNIGIAYQV